MHLLYPRLNKTERVHPATSSVLDRVCVIIIVFITGVRQPLLQLFCFPLSSLRREVRPSFLRLRIRCQQLNDVHLSVLVPILLLEADVHALYAQKKCTIGASLAMFDFFELIHCTFFTAAILICGHVSLGDPKRLRFLRGPLRDS